MRNKSKKIVFSIFAGYTIRVELCDDIEQTMRKYEHTKRFPYEGEGGLCVTRADRGISEIFIKHRSTPGVVAHESWHAVSAMLKWCGVELDNETVAYHLGYVVDQIARLQGIKFTREKQGH